MAHKEIAMNGEFSKAEETFLTKKMNFQLLVVSALCVVVRNEATKVGRERLPLHTHTHHRVSTEVSLINFFPLYLMTNV